MHISLGRRVQHRNKSLLDTLHMKNFNRHQYRQIRSNLRNMKCTH